MKRREFITLLGGAAAWPLAARAQQDRQRLVGVVAGFSESEMRPQLTALRSKLSQLGWTEGRNLEIDTRLGAGDFQRMTVEAGSLVSRNPDVIVTMGTPGLNAVRHHTKSVPVVFQLRSRLVGDSGPGDGPRPTQFRVQVCPKTFWPPGGRLKVRQTEHGAVSGADTAQGRKSPWSV